MQEVLTFTPRQRATFAHGLEVRNAAYDKWEQSATGKRYRALQAEYGAARKSGDQAKAEQIRPQLDALQKEQNAIRADLRREFDRPY